jgi:uncharacterized membrane protein YhaH (DUF805 family)
MTFKVFADPPRRTEMLPSYGDESEFSIASMLVRPFSFRGEATRLEYWLIWLTIIIVELTVALAMLKLINPDSEALRNPSGALLHISWITGLITIWMSLSVTVRRLRDRGWSTGFIVAMLLGSPFLFGALGLVCAAAGAPGLGSLLLLAMWPVQIWIFIECAFFGSKI